MNLRRMRGFTLLEITVVLLIIGLMIAGLFAPLETQFEARDRRQTPALLDDIQTALLGYALTHGRLPCPDTEGDGLSNLPWNPLEPVTSGACAQSVGILPWSELGVPGTDAWGNRYTYAVSQPEFTRPDTDALCNGGDEAGAHFDLCTRGRLNVRSRGDAPATSGIESKAELTTYATAIPAVVVSHGRNGSGAISAEGFVRAAPTGADEAENADADAVFMLRGYSRGGAGCADNATESSPLCEFDDLMIWVSSSVLSARMVQAGKLP
ncbi:MAG: type II secretion system protein [Gammaproteobacteria bacterium]|nr:type II secretion system protein [Gammaproteobacteria bacterium]